MNTTINWISRNLLYVLLAVAVMPASGKAATWAVYQDESEKCRLSYATSVFTPGEIDAEDFRRFSGPSKNIYFRVAGLLNDEDLSPRKIKAEYIKNRGKSKLVYEHTNTNFLVLSGIRDRKIFYSKIVMSPNTQNICVLHIVYPQKAKREFDAIVTRMSRSFKATD
jgi:hypothetical protein